MKFEKVQGNTGSLAVEKVVREASCIILMYDVCRQDTFQHATQNLYAQLKNTISESQFVMLIGNKMDQPETQRQVDFE